MEFEADFFSIGERRPEWKMMADGCIMEYSECSGLTLWAFYQEPCQEEIHAFSCDSAFQITFTDVKGIGFFCVKFGELPWSDCPFCPNLYDHKPEFSPLPEGIGITLNVLLIDSATGELKAIRLIGLGAAFSQSFQNWCVQALKKRYRSSILRRRYRYRPASFRWQRWR